MLAVTTKFYLASAIVSFRIWIVTYIDKLKTESKFLQCLIHTIVLYTFKNIKYTFLKMFDVIGEQILTLRLRCFSAFCQRTNHSSPEMMLLQINGVPSRTDTRSSGFLSPVLTTRTVMRSYFLHHFFFVKLFRQIRVLSIGVRVFVLILI